MSKLPALSLALILSGCSLVSEIPQNFDECVSKGGPILESLPRQCVWSGQTFVEDVKVEDPNNTQLANPASVNCTEKGGTLEIRTDESGAQTGFCHFDDGSECEEWAFFRDECQPASATPQTETGSTADNQTPICEDTCGNGTCDEMVCQAAGCPCAETAETCPTDCSDQN